MADVVKLKNAWHLGPELDSGGFAKVYVAHAPDGQEAVLKLIPKVPGADRELLFEDLAGVPNVVPILDRGSWRDYLVLVMPRAERSLRAYLNSRGGKLPVDDAVKVLLDVAEALVAIYGRVVHRDIKPENILLLKGAWCLSDFGIARYAETTTEPDTRKYAMTPPYAAPEQWRSERATSATDVYATGIVAYEMMAGKRPFAGPEAHDYRHQHLQESPSPVSDIPTSLQNLIGECLYKAPAARPQPENLLARLQGILRPPSRAAQRIQAAYQDAVAKQAEEEQQRSIAQSEAERRAELFRAAEASYATLAAMLYEVIVSNAPRSAPSGGAHWPCSLNGAQLAMGSVHMVRDQAGQARHDPPFEVIAYSHITIRIPLHRSGYEGRSHSLWYCDAQEPGVFRWYETAFMYSPLTAERRRQNPFALDPGDEAYGALSTVITKFQVAWPFIAADQGDETEFMERWITWLADAAQGKLEHPRTLPERDPKGSWRRD